MHKLYSLGFHARACVNFTRKKFSQNSENLGLNISAPRAPTAKKFICSESVDQARQYEAGCWGMWQGQRYW